MLSALSEGTDNLASKINIFVALAPVAIMNNTTEAFLDNLANQWKLI